MDEVKISEEEKMRMYFREFVDAYSETAEKISLPVDKEKLKGIIDTAEFRTFENHDTSGTFSVNRRLIQVIINNFKKNGATRNNFLLFHEFTHLISPINEELFTNQNAIFQEFQKRAEEYNNEFVTGLNAYYGLVAIDEVLAQYTCEELNDAFCKKTRTSCEYTEGPLGAKVKYKSDFSDEDIYSPLEEPVEAFMQKWGYKDLKDFAMDFLSSNKKLATMLDKHTFEKLCYIGIICKGIYKENKFVESLNVTSEDIQTAYRELNKNVSFGENNGGYERI